MPHVLNHDHSSAVVLCHSFAPFVSPSSLDRSCRRGLPLDEFGHHRAACAQAGMLSKRGWASENAVARICREAGGRVTTNVFMRDLDLGQPDVVDGRRIKVIVDGLPLHSGAQLAVDTTLVCHLAQQDGVVLHSARRRKERTYPELLGRRARAKLVVLTIEVGGKLSEETRMFLSLLAAGSLRESIVAQANSASLASPVGCTFVLHCASSMLELPRARGADGDTPDVGSMMIQRIHAVMLTFHEHSLLENSTCDLSTEGINSENAGQSMFNV